MREIGPLRPLLARRPLAVLSDIDGTLAPIVENPNEARVSDRAHAALECLLDRGVVVGLVTGRALVRAQEMARLPRAIYATNHGLTISVHGAVTAPESLRDWVEKAQALLPSLAHLADIGVSIEDKGAIIAFHFRRALAPDAARAAILRAVSAALAEGFALQEGRMVIEIRPPLHINKGTAAKDIARRAGARAVVCMGDDLTDIHMFNAVRSLGEAGLSTAVVAVISPEIQPEIVEAADYTVEGVEGVEWLLEEILAALIAASR